MHLQNIKRELGENSALLPLLVLGMIRPSFTLSAHTPSLIKLYIIHT